MTAAQSWTGKKAEPSQCVLERPGMMSWDALGCNNRKPPSVYIGLQSPGSLFFLHFLSLSVSSNSNTMKRDSLPWGRESGREAPRRNSPFPSPKGFTLAGALPRTGLSRESKVIRTYFECSITPWKETSEFSLRFRF